MDYNREHGTDVRIIRIFNTYGPRMALDDGRVVSNFVSQVGPWHTTQSVHVHAHAGSGQGPDELCIAGSRVHICSSVRCSLLCAGAHRQAPDCVRRRHTNTLLPGETSTRFTQHKLCSGHLVLRTDTAPRTFGVSMHSPVGLLLYMHFLLIQCISVYCARSTLAISSLVWSP